MSLLTYINYIVLAFESTCLLLVHGSLRMIAGCGESTTVCITKVIDFLSI